MNPADRAARLFPGLQRSTLTPESQHVHAHNMLPNWFSGKVQPASEKKDAALRQAESRKVTTKTLSCQEHGPDFEAVALEIFSGASSSSWVFLKDLLSTKTNVSFEASTRIFQDFFKQSSVINGWALKRLYEGGQETRQRKFQTP